MINIDVKNKMSNALNSACMQLLEEISGSVFNGDDELKLVLDYDNPEYEYRRFEYTYMFFELYEVDLYEKEHYEILKFYIQKALKICHYESFYGTGACLWVGDGVGDPFHTVPDAITAAFLHVYKCTFNQRRL